MELIYIYRYQSILQGRQRKGLLYRLYIKQRQGKANAKPFLYPFKHKGAKVAYM